MALSWTHCRIRLYWHSVIIAARVQQSASANGLFFGGGFRHCGFAHECAAYAHEQTSWRCSDTDQFAVCQRSDRAHANDIVAKLKANSVAVKGKDDITKVAAIAANNDAKIGQHVADALDKVGKDGVATLDEGKSMQTEIEWVEGMQFDKGYMSPYFVTDSSKMECVLEEPYILIHEKKISSIKDIVPLLEKVVQARKPLLIICEDVEGDRPDQSRAIGIGKCRQRSNLVANQRCLDR